VTESDLDRVWTLMERVRFCMFSNWNGSRIHSRPMGAFVRRHEGLIYFATDDRAHKDAEIAQYPKVGLAFADIGGQKYVSVSGTAKIGADREKLKELWSVPLKLWWSGPDDPNIRLITVVPHEAEYWDAPGNLISGLKVAFTLVSGVHLGYGTHKRVDL
jgi:general stress protein 26